MQLRLDQLAGHLRQPLAPLYVVHGDEPLLAMEAADAIRAASRVQGCTERELLMAERGFDWAAFLHASAAGSLFGDRKFIELRLPTGKPGTQGSAAIERYCAQLNPDMITLVSVPRLDKTGQNSAWFRALMDVGVCVDIWPVERARLADWIAQRLLVNKQRADRDTLNFLADRVEGNLLAAHQEVQKLALLLPAGEISLDAVQAAVTDVARFDVQRLAEAFLSGDTARYARVLEGLRGEGEAPTLLLWALAEELRALGRIVAGTAAGRPMDQLFRENRVWRNKEAAVRAALRRSSDVAIRRGLSHAARIDRMAKGVAQGNVWDEFLQLGLHFAHGTR